MAGFGLCDRLVRHGVHRRHSIVVFGEEPTPPYDRVNLSKLFSGRDADDLLLARWDWYHAHRIRLVTRRRVTAIDRLRREVTDGDGHRHAYDRLVLATGSHAWVPPVPGRDLPGVFAYRTMADLRRIDDHARQRGARRGAVIGGGLLGLEAARVLHDLGLETHVIEMAPGLMPRQLDAAGAARLKVEIEAMGVAVHLVRRTERITSNSEAGLTLHFSNAEPLDIDILIFAAGVRPNDALAKQCDLQLGPRGGIAIDETLTTSDPNIHAIGECASFRKHVYGLVGPCYRMADVLAARLAGGNDLFRGADESAELKLMGVQVATLGRAIGQSRGGVVLTHRHDAGYRKVLLEQGRVVGASCVGPWEELPQIRLAIGKQQRLWPWQRTRFTRHGTPWLPTGRQSVRDWPGDSVVCSCLNVTRATIGALIDDGAKDAAAIAARCGASTACGSCRPLLDEWFGEAMRPKQSRSGKVMLAASVLTCVAVMAWLIMPPIAFADSVQSEWRRIDVLWRNDTARQITGFSLLALTLLGMLFSLRKRLVMFRWGSYASWRALHGVLGVAVVFGLIAHTGFRLGSHLNFLLGCTFLAAAAMGGIAGMLSGMEGRLTGHAAMWVRQWRPRLAKWHLWVTWPLPVLILLHIVSFYWFSD